MGVVTGLAEAARELRGYRYVETARRLFDDKPLQCSLYVTDQCNLDCAYCTEYDNSKPHPSLAELKTWLTKIRALGTVRVALVGGEPLMHPDIVEVVRHARAIGLATSLTTNGFLLTKTLVQDLDEAGLEVMQVSVDRMTPSTITRKSFKTVLPKLDLLRGSRINLHITGVLCADTMNESRAVLKTGLERHVPTGRAPLASRFSSCRRRENSGSAACAIPISTSSTSPTRTCSPTTRPRHARTAAACTAASARPSSTRIPSKSSAVK